MSLFGQSKRHTPTAPKRVRSPLPIFTGDMEKKYDIGSSSPGGLLSQFLTVVYVPIPRIGLGRSNGSGGGTSETILHVNGHAHSKSYPTKGRRYVRICLPIPPRLYAKIPKSPVRLILGILLGLALLIFILGFRRRPGGRGSWSPPFTDPDTTVVTPEEISMIWEWEILSGHHPSLESPPDTVTISPSIYNPAVPEKLVKKQKTTAPIVGKERTVTTKPKPHLIGSGADRNFLSVVDERDAKPGYPPRPTPGTILDLDLILEKCDFGTNNYVRDCLEFLRIGGQLDNGRRVRRGNFNLYEQSYYESGAPGTQGEWNPILPTVPKPRSPKLSRTALTLSPPLPIAPSFDSKHPCDPNHPRVFHMFWAGPFTDKPYMAVMSYLFTQNLGLDNAQSRVTTTCRPQFWVWINPGPAAAVPNPSAKREMYEQLATNPWSAPFLHERFREVVKFKMWNTTEQLDGVPELKEHWRQMPIFNSGGNTYNQPAPLATQLVPPVAEPKLGDILEEQAQEQTEKEAPMTRKKNTIFDKVGSSSESDYDRLSVILSDMARFVLTHRFGGIYLDADTIFLRDWEELWNYRGQFAYRWSWHQKYNTAVLKLHKESALGTFLFKTALENGLDFHPMTVSRYLKDAGLDKLLFRVPDALFDPAWLNMERYQRERPPFPYFPEFSVFFSNDKFDTAGAQPLGFDGFFRGAFSYHFHNFWWLPFDPSRNWPDLGPRFSKGEKALREAARAKSAQAEGGVINTALIADPIKPIPIPGKEDLLDDEVDLSWSTVLKRTFEAYLRMERPNMYGEWMTWDSKSD